MIAEVDVCNVLAVSAVAVKFGNGYGVGVELAQHSQPVKRLSFYVSSSETKKQAVYSVFNKITQYIPDDIQLLLIRCEQGLHISRHAVVRRLQKNVPQVYISSAQLHDYRYRKLLDLAKTAI